jgi:hypothetical protein
MSQGDTWKNPRVLLLLLLVFACGAVSGAAVVRYTVASAAPQSVGPYWKEAGKTVTLERFKKELDLTPKQAEEIEVILDDFVMYYQTLQSQMDEVRANGKSRIVKVLNDDQKQKFTAMLDDLQQKLH